MKIIIQLFMGLSALLHFYFMFFEMFAWESRGKKVFKSFPKDMFAKTKELAANLGLYNGFLASGLTWTFFIQDVFWKNNIALFFLTCITIAGIYGAFSAEKKIFYVQALPALIPVILILFGRM